MFNMTNMTVIYGWGQNPLHCTCIEEDIVSNLNGLGQNRMVRYYIINVLPQWVLDLEIYLQTMQNIFAESVAPSFTTRKEYVYYSTT